MKTSSLTIAAGAGLGLLFSALMPLNSLGGPGPQYWQSVGKPVVEPAKPAPAPMHACAGATVVPVMAMRPAQANGRGQMVEVQTGTKTVCHMCPVTTIVRTNTQANGRGTWTTKEVTQPGAEHTCTNCAVTVAKL